MRARPTPRLALPLAVLAVAASGCVVSVYEGALTDAKDFIREGRYQSALEELDRAKRARTLDEDDAAEIAFLEASCLERQGRVGEAVVLDRRAGTTGVGATEAAVP